MALRTFLAAIFVIAGILGHTASATEIKLDTQAFARALTQMALKRSTCKQLREDLREAQHRKNLMIVNGIQGKESLALIGSSQPWNEASSDERVQLSQGRYKAIADSLIAWLNTQPQYSVTPLELVNKAMTLAGDDLFAALGTIGQVFQEDGHAQFGSRVTPLFVGHSTYPVDYNTRFWKHLNANLIHVDFTAKYTRWIPKKLAVDQIPEHLGFTAGAQLHALIRDRLHCKEVREKL